MDENMICNDESKDVREMVRVDESNPHLWLRLWTEKLLGFQNAPGPWFFMCCDYFSKCCDFVGIDDRFPETNILKDTKLPSGKALSVYTAALCTRQGNRTVKFIQGIHQAIKDLKKRFPDETLRVLYAGTGPLAPLAFPLLAFHGCCNISYDCIDIHPESLEYAKSIATYFGVEKGISEWICCDAATFNTAESHPGYHLIITEVMQEALRSEPQVAVTINLSKLLVPGGVFVPEQIRLSLQHFDQGSYLNALLNRSVDISEVTEFIADVFELSVKKAREWGALGDRLPAAQVNIPCRSETRWVPSIFTDIQIYKTHKLGVNECSLNLPVDLSKLIQDKSEVEFYYEIGEDPGLRVLS